MNEIEKLYENAGVEPIYPYTKCYPDFTAEKQLELIKWLSKRRLLNVVFSNDKNTYQFFNCKNFFHIIYPKTSKSAPSKLAKTIVG